MQHLKFSLSNLNGIKWFCTSMNTLLSCAPLRWPSNTSAVSVGCWQIMQCKSVISTLTWNDEKSLRLAKQALSMPLWLSLVCCFNPAGSLSTKSQKQHEYPLSVFVRIGVAFDHRNISLKLISCLFNCSLLLLLPLSVSLASLFVMATFCSQFIFALKTGCSPTKKIGQL